MNSKTLFGKRLPLQWLMRKAYSSTSTHLLPEPPDFTERLTHELSIPSNEPKHIMSKLKAILLMVLLAAASPPLLQAQITETYTFTTSRVLPDGNASGLQ